MTHVAGHIVGGGGSFGLLSLDADTTIKLDFLPPNFSVAKGDKVGFHPIFNYAHTEILSYNIAKWEDHEEAEQMAISYIGGGVTAIEQIYNNDAQKGALMVLLAMGKMPDEYRNILQDVLNYFNTSDFERLYINSKGQASSDYAAEQIIKFYSQNPIALKASAAKSNLAKTVSTTKTTKKKPKKKK